MQQRGSADRLPSLESQHVRGKRVGCGADGRQERLYKFPSGFDDQQRVGRVIGSRRE